jgi:hypothetical protein
MTHQVTQVTPAAAVAASGGRRYEIRIAGRLSIRARQAFLPMSVVEPPVETVLHDPPGGGAGLDDVLSTIQDLGLRVLSIHEIPS